MHVVDAQVCKCVCEQMAFVCERESYRVRWRAIQNSMNIRLRLAVAFHRIHSIRSLPLRIRVGPKIPFQFGEHCLSVLIACRRRRREAQCSIEWITFHIDLITLFSCSHSFEQIEFIFTHFGLSQRRDFHFFLFLLFPVVFFGAFCSAEIT